MREVFSTPVFYLALTLLAFSAGQWLNRKTGSPIANPLLIGCLIVGAYLTLFEIPLSEYNTGGGFLTLCFTPSTICLAVPIYRQLSVLRRNLLPILAGVLAGSLTSIFSVLLLGRLFGLDRHIILSLLPKSVTTPIGLALSQSLGGLTAVTSLAIIFTGIMGAVFLPTALRLLGVQHPVTTGIAIGTASHAIGTSRALELGEIEGAMSGLAIGIAGLITAVALSLGAAFFL